MPMMSEARTTGASQLILHHLFLRRESPEGTRLGHRARRAEADMAGEECYWLTALSTPCQI